LVNLPRQKDSFRWRARSLNCGTRSSSERQVFIFSWVRFLPFYFMFIFSLGWRALLHE
jgi:hypothetical protein